MHDSSKIVQRIAVIVMAAGTGVLLGWIYSIPVLTNIFSHWESMKATTALCFILSGVTLYFIVEAKKGRITLAQTVLPIPVFVIVLIITSHLVSSLFNIQLSMEGWFAKRDYELGQVVIPGRPSAGTMLCFGLMVIAGLVSMFNPGNLNRQFNAVGAMLSILAGAAIIGYLTHLPFLYYAIPHKSSGMAFHTAVLFGLLGFALMILARPGKAARHEKY